MSGYRSNEAAEIVRRVALDQAIARKSDEYDAEASRYAEQLRNTKLDSSQVRGLESLAYTTDKVSDVTDWLKSRIGRDSKAERWAKGQVGIALLNSLRELSKHAGVIAAELRENHPLPEEDPDLERQIHLRLIREYLKHLAAHFEYLKAQMGKQ